MALTGPPGLPSMYSMICYLAEFPKGRVEVHQGLLAHAWEGYLVFTPHSDQSQSQG